ncbi:MAG: hypothetical protein H0V09_01055, partial [Gemmatimonadetes bacterium]|nr:hypothetical protein [Gemmatimonadota bacterium]
MTPGAGTAETASLTSESRPWGGFFRWQLDALRARRRNPRPDVRFGIVPHALARPRASPGELRVTWVGHATVLLQTADANL